MSSSESVVHFGIGEKNIIDSLLIYCVPVKVEGS